MINPLKGAGFLPKLYQQSQQLDKQLENEEVTVDENGVKIVMTANQKVKSVEVDGIQEPRLAEAFNKIIQETKVLAAQRYLQLFQNQEELTE
ncbi:MAG: hypothetical protein KatS3mg091_060 [Patescibacteria group bacterium]|nr:MAG: hypothetical protein KatS3mg091_060 [Patescibacteria group bacterium]